jgi:septum formation protein
VSSCQDDGPRALILASSSPYRRELLERLRLPFSVRVPGIDETPLTGETPAATALRLAEAKARAVAVQAPGALVIGSDQVATLDGRQIGKPGSHAAALTQLRAMRGREVEFHSALCLFDARSGTLQRADIVTHVTFRDLPDAELDAYLRAETPYDVAGSAKAEGLGIALLEAIRSDDPTALIGLPLIALSGMLRQAGFNLAKTSHGSAGPSQAFVHPLGGPDAPATGKGAL